GVPDAGVGGRRDRRSGERRLAGRGRARAGGGPRHMGRRPTARTDDAGRFRRERVPVGRVTVFAYSPDPASKFHGARLVREVPGGAAEVELPEIRLARREVWPESPQGDLGYTLVQGAAGHV